MGDTAKGELANCWADMYRSVLRMRPVLEPPYANSDEGAWVHGEFCGWLRGYLIRVGANAESLARVEMEADIERENWHAVWSGVPVGATRRDPSGAR